MTDEEFKQKWKKKYDKSKMIGKDFWNFHFNEISDDLDEILCENCEEWAKEYYKNFVDIKDVNIGDINSYTRRWTKTSGNKI